ncbi:MAG: tetratricopeptide repeat protein [Planctomycetota bacterium]|jgi:tetratricopeptide (TPR) repeat protein
MRTPLLFGLFLFLGFAAESLLAHNPGSAEIATLTKQLEKDPKNVDLLVRRARLFLVFGDLPDARKDLDQILSLDPGNEVALGLRGNVHYLKGNWEPACRDLSAAIEAGEKDAAMVALRGKVYLQLGQAEKAVQDLNRALALKEYDVWLCDRAKAFEALGKLDEAIRDMEQLVEVTGGYFGSADLVRLLMLKGKPQKAIQVLDAAIEVDPLPLYYLLRGEAKKKTGDAQASEDFRRTLQGLADSLDRKNWGAADHQLAARALAGLRRWKEALAEVEEAKNKEKDDTDILPLIEKIRRQAEADASGDGGEALPAGLIPSSSAPPEEEESPTLGDFLLYAVLGGLCLLALSLIAFVLARRRVRD